MNRPATALLVLAALAPAQGLTPQAPSLVRGPWLQLQLPTAVTVCFRTSLPVSPVVRYGTAPGLLGATAAGPVGTEHRIRLTGLAPATRYWYSVDDAATGPLAGAPVAPSFRQPPPVGSRAPMRAWVIGDSGTGNTNARAVRNAFEAFAGSHPPDLWLMLGDNAYPNGSDADYQKGVFDTYPDRLARAALWPAFGNHDANSASGSSQTGPFFEIFELPAAGEAGGAPSGTEAYYSFDQGNVHFVCLDSQSHTPTSLPDPAMLSWLQADLAGTTQDWIVAYWHHPPYTKGSHDSDTEDRLIRMRQHFVPVLESYGVDLVLTGHSHSYERSMLLDGHTGASTTFDPMVHARSTTTGDPAVDAPYRKSPVGEGAVYVVAGSSGKISNGPLDHPVMIASLYTLGSVVLDVNGLQMTARFIDAFGAVQDTWTLVKGGVAAARMATVAVPAAATWRYHDLGVDLGTGWRDPAYDDSAWPAGAGPLGTGYPGVATTTGLVPGGVLPRTTYFRIRFDAPHLPRVTSLRLRVRHSDGFVAWINGTEAARRGIAPATVVHTTQGSPNPNDDRFLLSDVSGSLPSLQATGNLLAIEVHRSSSTDADLLMDAVLELEGFVPVLGGCAAGTLGEEVLLVNGSAGGAARAVDVPVREPPVIHLLNPSTHPGSAEFLLFGMAGTPTAAHATPVGGLGTFCVPPALILPAPDRFLLAGSPGVPGSILPAATGLPWTWTLPMGFAAPGVEVTLEALVERAPGTWEISNAVRVRSYRSP